MQLRDRLKEKQGEGRKVSTRARERECVRARETDSARAKESARGRQTEREHVRMSYSEVHLLSLPVSVLMYSRFRLSDSHVMIMRFGCLFKNSPSSFSVKMRGFLV